MESYPSGWRVAATDEPPARSRGAAEAETKVHHSKLLVADSVRETSLAARIHVVHDWRNWCDRR
jgi:hypothetical protein